MSNVAIVVTIVVDASRRDEALAALKRHRDRCNSEEPGTLAFELMTADDDPTIVMLYEVYADKAAFDRHWDGPSMKTYRTETEGIARIAHHVWGKPLI